MHVIVGLYVGGAEMMLYNLLRATDRDKFAPSVIALMGRGAQRDIIEEVKALDVPVYTLGLNLSRPTPGSAFRGFSRLVRTLRRIKPDVIQAWMYHSSIAALFARPLSVPGAKLVWAIHHTRDDALLRSRINKMFDDLGRRFSAQPAHTVYVSETSRMQHGRDGYDISRSSVLPNGFDMKRFAPSPESRRAVREEIGVAPDTFLVGLFSRFHPMKDHANFFRAAGLLALSHPEVHFVLAGANVFADNPELAQMARENGVAEQTHFLGERKDIDRLAASLDIMSLSSAHGEAFPMVVGEAMSCGVACVVTDVGESAAMVGKGGEAGFVVPPLDAQALADGWKRIVEASPAERERLSHAARARIEQNFSLEAVTRAYEEIYTDLAS